MAISAEDENIAGIFDKIVEAINALILSPVESSIKQDINAMTDAVASARDSIVSPIIGLHQDRIDEIEDRFYRVKFTAKPN